MAVQPGARLGACGIRRAIGAGGMGEVYRATDTKLKRAAPASLIVVQHWVEELKRLVPTN
jgi:hypothetical protein